MKIKFLKKVRYFYFYKKILKLNKLELKNKFNLEVDRIQRLWTVIQIPKENAEDISKYGHSYIDNEVSKYIKVLDEYFRKIRISEFIKIENIEVLNPLEIGLVFTYKFFNPKKIFYFKLIGFLIILILIFSLIIIL